MRKMQRKVVKISIFFLSLLCLLSALGGCAKPDETAFLAEAERLLTEAEKVNVLCFGEGILPKDGGYKVGSYTEADEESLAYFGVTSLASVREKIAAVYSVTTAEWVEKVTLSATYEDSEVLSYSRYYDATTDADEGNRKVLMVKEGYEALLNSRATYSNLRVVELSSRRAEILVDVTVTNAEGESRTETDVSLQLRYEENGWRFDQATYQNY